MTVAGAVDDLPRPAEVAEVGLAASPWAMLAIALAWGGAGIRVAVHEARRGHELRHLLPIGLAMGPLLVAYARSSLRRLEGTAEVVVVRQTDTRRHPGLLIALLGEAHDVADVLPMLARIVEPGSSVEVARPVTFDAARAGTDDDDRRRATRALEDAGLFLHEFDPGLLLVPGPELASLQRLADERHAEFLAIVDGDPDTGRGRVEILATGAGRQVHHR